MKTWQDGLMAVNRLQCTDTSSEPPMTWHCHCNCGQACICGRPQELLQCTVFISWEYGLRSESHCVTFASSEELLLCTVFSSYEYGLRSESHYMTFAFIWRTVTAHSFHFIAVWSKKWVPLALHDIVSFSAALHRATRPDASQTWSRTRRRHFLALCPSQTAWHRVELLDSPLLSHLLRLLSPRQTWTWSSRWSVACIWQKRRLHTKRALRRRSVRRLADRRSWIKYKPNGYAVGCFLFCFPFSKLLCLKKCKPNGYAV